MININYPMEITRKTEFIQAKTRREAVKIAPWAAEIVKVCGGYMAFESVEDAKVWKNQK